jgi:hypothetical protein
MLMKFIFIMVIVCLVASAKAQQLQAFSRVGSVSEYYSIDTVWNKDKTAYLITEQGSQRRLEEEKIKRYEKRIAELTTPRQGDFWYDGEFYYFIDQSDKRRKLKEVVE